MPECDHSPTREHQWEFIGPAKLVDGREDWSVVPGTYCTLCGTRQEGIKKLGPYGDWPIHGH